MRSDYGGRFIVYIHSSLKQYNRQRVVKADMLIFFCSTEKFAM